MTARLLPLALAAISAISIAACGGNDEPGAMTPAAEDAVAPIGTEAANPLLEDWDTPFATPPFDRIASADYLPAFRAGMAEQTAEIDAIVRNADAPTFANTLEALERSGGNLSRITRAFYAVNGAHSDEVIRETASTVAPELSSHRDDISLNRRLFERIDAVFAQRDDLQLSPEQLRLLEETHRNFLRAGAGLEIAAQSRLRAINAELATLSEKFRSNLLADTNDFELLVTEREDLGDLPASLVELAAEEAKRRGHSCECWAFTLQRPSIDPFLQFSPNREMRRYLFEGYAMRGNNGNENDNKAVLARIAALRVERAKLMGFASHAEYALEDRMAGNTARVYGLLDSVWEPAIRTATRDRDARQALLRTDGIEGRLEPWDWAYYSEKLRKAGYDFDEDALRPYFEVGAVRDGAFALANRLFGLTFRRREDLPGWHPDQQVFEVFDADGSHLAILYMDFFARESKRGGAWMNSLRPQSRLDGEVTPIVTTNFNFPAPSPGSPSLLGLGDAETMFHEFGHALHGMLSDVSYPSLSGTSVPRDFVEFPSQVMENWMREPEVLRMFARHHETGEEIPAATIEKIGASAAFDQGFKTVEYLAASYLDMAWHVRESTDVVDPLEFERGVLEEIGLIPEIIPRYRSTYFQHIFASGYSAGYYSYLWSEVLDADAFRAFQEAGLFDPDTAARYRKEILEKGGTRPGMELYLNFRGREPDPAALLERRGFLPGETTAAD